MTIAILFIACCLATIRITVFVDVVVTISDAVTAPAVECQLEQMEIK